MHQPFMDVTSKLSLSSSLEIIRGPNAVLFLLNQIKERLFCIPDLEVRLKICGIYYDI